MRSRKYRGPAAFSVFCDSLFRMLFFFPLQNQTNHVWYIGHVLCNAVHSCRRGCVRMRRKPERIRTINVESRWSISHPPPVRSSSVHPPSQPPLGARYSLYPLELNRHGAITLSSVASGALYGEPQQSRLMSNCASFDTGAGYFECVLQCVNELDVSRRCPEEVIN